MYILRRIIFSQIVFCIFLLFSPSLVFGKVIDVPFKSQVPPGLWEETRNCGQTSYLMTDAYFSGIILSEQDIKDLDDWIEAVFGEDQRGYSGNYTNVSQLKKVAVEYGGYSDEDIQINREGKLDLLKEHLYKGHPIIVAVYTNMFLKGKNKDVPHFMVLTGIDEQNVYVNDPGKTKGKDNVYTIEQFKLAWSKNNYAIIIFDVDDKDIVLETPIIQSESPPKFIPTENIFYKLFNFVSTLLSPNSNNAQSEELGQVLGDQVAEDPDRLDVSEEDIDIVKEFAGIFIPEYIIIPITESHSESVVTITVKNTGNTVWQAGTVSLNVVGGWEKNEQWYHSSWKTKLRPIILSKDIAPGASEQATFSISLANSISTSLKLQLVRQVGTQFLQIGTSFVDVSLKYVAKDSKESSSHLTEEQNDTFFDSAFDSAKKFIKKVKDKTDVLGEKIFDITKDIFDSVPPIFYGSGSSGSSNISPEKVVYNIIEPKLTLDTKYIDGSFVTTNTLFLSGTKNDITEDIIFSVPSTTLSFPSSTLWEAETLLREGENIITFIPVDKTGLEGKMYSFSITLDSIAPNIISFIAERMSTNSIDIVLSWSAEDATSGIASYDVDVRTDGGEWKTLFDMTTTTAHTFIGTQPHIYSFRARAIDTAGNVSDWLESSVSLDWEKSVVINEIAWGGTASVPKPTRDCRQHEWIELKNTTNEIIDLSGWSIALSSPYNVTSSINLSGNIIPNGYHLLVRREGGYEALVDIPIDIVYTLNEIKDGGMSMILLDKNGDTIDEVSFQNGWPAGTLGISMERVVSDGSGSDPTNWKTAEHISARGTTNGCGMLYGSPLQPNRRLWLLRDMFTNYANMVDDTGTLTLTAEHSPYILDNKTVVPVGKTLVVEHGVVLVGRAPETTLVVEGVARFLGKESDHVRITSARDASDGTWRMDRVGDGEPSPGDWSHIHVLSGATLDLLYTDVLYGGYPFLSSGGFVFGAVPQAQVIRTEGNTSMSNSSIFYSYIHPNKKYATHNSNVSIAGGVLSIVDSLFDTGNIAIKNEARSTGEVNIESTTFSNFSSTEGVVVLYGIWPKNSQNVFLNNTGSNIVIPTYTFKEDFTISAGSSIVGVFLVF